MKEVAEYFDKLLWFVYRVLFALLPSIFFLLIVYAFFVSTNVDGFALINRYASALGIAQWVVVLAIGFCLNLLLEAITGFAFRILNFRKITLDRYREDKALHKLLSTYSPKILELLKANDDRIVLEDAVFNFGVLNGGQKSIWFNNYLWFLISREFLFSNISLVIIFSLLFFLPSYIHTKYSMHVSILVALEIMQLIATALLFVFTKKLLNLHYPATEIDYNFRSQKSIKLMLIPIAGFTISILLWPFNEWAPWSLFCLMNSILYFTAPLLFLRALREFVHVEYLIMTFFARDEYERQHNDKSPKL